MFIIISVVKDSGVMDVNLEIGGWGDDVMVVVLYDGSC